MTILDQLATRPLVCDGAMGTQLMARGLPTGVCPDAWAVDHAGVLTAIHQAYRAAGCDLLTTCTFGASRLNLERHGLAQRVTGLNIKAARIAKQAAGPGGLVLGDVGPFGDFLEPVGTTTRAQLEEVFTEQIASLQVGGVDGIIVETMVDPAELACAVEIAKRVNNWPVFATYAFVRTPDGSFRTMMGTSVAEAMAAAIAAGADVVGSNCGTKLGPDDYRELAVALVAAAQGKPVILQPNAGSPSTDPAVPSHPSTPEDMARLAADLRAAGVRIVGGCCGTSPDHLKAMAQAVKAGAR